MQIDQPLHNVADDQLSRGSFVKQLSKALVDDKSKLSTGLVVGLAGEWGSGKSSVLNFVEKELRDTYPQIALLRFDPWLISGRDDLLHQFFADLVLVIEKASSKKLKKETTKLVKLLKEYGSIVDFAIDTLPVPESIKKVAKASREVLSQTETNTPTLHDLRREIEARIESLPFPIVVLVDEIDRIDDEEVAALARLVKAVAGFRKVSYLLAYDAGRVMQALGKTSERNRLSRGRSYLEKIVQHQVQLPSIFEDELSDLLRSAIRAVDNAIEFPHPDAQKQIYVDLERLLIPRLIRTPRDIKRIVGSFAVLRQMIKGEVNWTDTLAYGVLLSKAPELAEKVRAYPSYFASNFVQAASFYRYGINPPNETEQLKEVMGESFQERDLKELITFMFPRFLTKDDTQKSYKLYDQQDAKRISNYRALCFLVRQGIPPNSWSAKQVSKLLKLPQNKLKEALERARRDNRLPDLDYALSYFYDEYEGIDDVSVWVGIANWLKKTNLTPNATPGEQSRLTHVFADTFNSAIEKSARLKTTAVKIVDALHENRETEFLSYLIRNQIFAHGMFGKAQRRDYNPFGDKAKLNKTFLEIGENWRSSHLQGNWFNSLWGANAIWCLKDMGVWDDECKSRLRLICAAPNLFNSLLMMSFPRGAKVSRESIEEIYGWSEFELRLTKVLESRSEESTDELGNALSSARYWVKPGELYELNR